jgi:hypothetical protein
LQPSLFGALLLYLLQRALLLMIHGCRPGRIRGNRFESIPVLVAGYGRGSAKAALARYSVLGAVGHYLTTRLVSYLLFQGIEQVGECELLALEQLKSLVFWRGLVLSCQKPRPHERFTH